jgi:hypothetical protein
VIECKCGADLTGRASCPNIRIVHQWSWVEGGPNNTTYRAVCDRCGRASTPSRLSVEAAVSDLYDEHAIF